MNATSMMLAGFVAKLRRNGEKNKFFPVFLERFFLKYNGYLQMAFAMSFSSRHCPRLMVSFSLWCSHGARISSCPLAQASIVFLSIVSFSKDTTFFKKMFYLCN